MAKEPLAFRVEYAILEAVFWDRSKATHQDSWGGWQLSVRKREPDSNDADLRSAFKRLWRRGLLLLTNPDLDPPEYSGDPADDNRFFHIGRFNATSTDEGRAHWDRIELEKPNVPIGFRS